MTKESWYWFITQFIIDDKHRSVLKSGRACVRVCSTTAGQKIRLSKTGKCSTIEKNPTFL